MLNGSNVAPYALTMVLSLLGFVFFGLKQGKHTPLHIANPFALLAVVGSGIAYMTFSILSWINDRSEYKMLKGLYYIGCNLAFISLLFMLFTTT
ncbi:hypothetical protein HanRHA438_Chr11g0514711 [Helianthus annuus]|nr:hypothetical protein HanIR_Chr11g0540511 [Helianthus annuus]KAJ0871632.1 hypothetical protein HanRHA438_Chr11g0514711 [Helianthus annuus]